MSGTKESRPGDIPRSNATTVVEPRELDQETATRGPVEEGDESDAPFYAICREDYNVRVTGDDERYPPSAKISVLYARRDGVRSFVRMYDAESVDGQEEHAFHDGEPYSVVHRQPDYGVHLPKLKAKTYARRVERLHFADEGDSRGRST